MITMGEIFVPSRTIREMICASIDVSNFRAARLRGGSRRITHTTAVMGMEGDTIITQDLFPTTWSVRTANGTSSAAHRSPARTAAFWDRARYYGAEEAALPLASTPPK